MVVTKTNDLETNLKKRIVDYIDLSTEASHVLEFEREVLRNQELFSLLLSSKSTELKTTLKQRKVNPDHLLDDIHITEDPLLLLRKARFDVLYDNVMREPEKKKHAINRIPKRNTPQIQDIHAREIRERMIHAEEFKDWVTEDWINNRLANDFMSFFPRMDSAHVRDDYQMGHTARDNIKYFIGTSEALRRECVGQVCNYMIHKKEITNPIVRDDFATIAQKPYTLAIMKSLQENRDTYLDDQDYKKSVKIYVRDLEGQLEEQSVNTVKPRKRKPRY